MLMISKKIYFLIYLAQFETDCYLNNSTTIKIKLLVGPAILRQAPPTHHLLGHRHLVKYVCLSGSVSHSRVHPKVGGEDETNTPEREALKDNISEWDTLSN